MYSDDVDVDDVYSDDVDVDDVYSDDVDVDDEDSDDVDIDDGANDNNGDEGGDEDYTVDVDQPPAMAALPAERSSNAPQGLRKRVHTSPPGHTWMVMVLIYTGIVCAKKE